MISGLVLGGGGLAWAGDESAGDHGEPYPYEPAEGELEFEGDGKGEPVEEHLAEIQEECIEATGDVCEVADEAVGECTVRTYYMNEIEWSDPYPGTARLVSSETGDTVWTNTLYKLMPAGSDGTLTYARAETLNTGWNLSASASVEYTAGVQAGLEAGVPGFGSVSGEVSHQISVGGTLAGGISTSTSTTTTITDSSPALAGQCTRMKVGYQDRTDTYSVPQYQNETIIRMATSCTWCGEGAAVIHHCSGWKEIGRHTHAHTLPSLVSVEKTEDTWVSQTDYLPAAACHGR
ncbi:MAG: hypothetical protein AAF799_35230 [Myxococcota bacterium]